MKYKYLFGPVPSRRLGVSLGVDLIPFKTCTLDCVYCECGKTTRLTIERKAYVPIDQVKVELEDYLSGNPVLDYITFSGSGEPTLNRDIGSLITFIGNKYPQYRMCVLTNGTLFSDPVVREAVGGVDLLIPSLDAASEKAFQLINRPHPNLNCFNVINGLIALRQIYDGIMIMEIFIVPGLNDDDKELSAIKSALGKIAPDRVQLGTLDRPGTEDWVEAAGREKMKEISTFLGHAEIIGDLQSRCTISSFQQSYSRQILQLLRRRPCTLNDLEQVLNLHPAELQKYLNHLLENNNIESQYRERGLFFKIKKSPGQPA